MANWKARHLFISNFDVMKYFIFKGILILLAVFVIDRLVGFTSKAFFLNLAEKDTEVAIMYQAFFNKKTDVLILGASAARHHYNVDLLKDELKSDVYNSGLDGRDVIYSDLVLQSYLRRCKLKTVIFDISEPQLNGLWLDRIDICKMYYGMSDVITNYYDTESDLGKRLKLLSKLYCYNRTFTDLIRLRQKPINKTGYTPLFGKIKDLTPKLINEFEVDSIELYHLDNIVKICKDNGVNILFVQSPKEINNHSFNKWLKSYANKKNILLISENQNSYYYKHAEFFKDASHLNNKGAEIFSKNIVRNIINNY